jgi:hypothetical protein
MYILRVFGRLGFGIMGCTVIVVSVRNCIEYGLCLVADTHI